MTCNFCKRKFNYCFYINDEYWRRVVGGEWFEKNIGHVCAHCTLEKLGGLDWYIVWNEPAKNIMESIRSNSDEPMLQPKSEPKSHPCSDPELKSHCSGCTDIRSEGTHQGCTIEHGHVGCDLAK
jgi:hypothetical protein